MLQELKAILWPTLEQWNTIEQLTIRAETQDELEEIGRVDWRVNPDVALSESLRVFVDEEERRKTAESKATNILLVIAALISLFTYLETAFAASKLGGGSKELSLILLALSTLYLVKSAHWAVRAILVATYHSVSTHDLVSLWKQPAETHLSSLVKMRLRFTRLNQDGINHRVSAVKMAQAFLFRALVGFGLVMVSQVGWELVNWIRMPAV